MAVWHRRRRGDIALRALGCGALFVAALAVQALIGTAGHGGAAASSPAAFLLATIGFLGITSGGALTLLGAHLFDQVEVSSRWRTLPVDRRDFDTRAMMAVADADRIDR